MRHRPHRKARQHERDDPSQDRYEIYDDEELAGFSNYRLIGSEIAFARRNLAKQLVREALDDARQRGLRVLPFCPYVRRFMERNAEQYLDLVPENQRERFGLTTSSA